MFHRHSLPIHRMGEPCPDGRDRGPSLVQTLCWWSLGILGCVRPWQGVVCVGASVRAFLRPFAQAREKTGGRRCHWERPQRGGRHMTGLAGEGGRVAEAALMTRWGFRGQEDGHAFQVVSEFARVFSYSGRGLKGRSHHVVRQTALYWGLFMLCCHL